MQRLVTVTSKEELLNSGGKRLVESVRGDIFWSTGLPPRIAESTKHYYFPGENQLGHVLESVRFDLMKEAILCNDVHEIHAISEEILSSSDETFRGLPITDSKYIKPFGKRNHPTS